MTHEGTDARVLEIGCGYSAQYIACESGGAIFDNDNVSYIGIDLAEVIESSMSDVSKRPDVQKGSCAALSFDEDSFDVVLLRSVFGEQTDVTASDDLSFCLLYTSDAADD